MRFPLSLHTWIAVSLTLLPLPQLFAHLGCTTKEAKELYKLPLYAYPGKDDFDKQTVHIKDETVIMLCYVKDSAQMMVYWKSGLSVGGAEEIMKQNGSQWTELRVEGFDNEVIKKHDENPVFRLDPYLKQLRVWKNTRGDLAFFDSFRHELVIQSASLGEKRHEIPNQDFYQKLRGYEPSTASVAPSPEAAK